MATQTIESLAITNETLIMKVYPPGSDTATDSQSATEKTNQDGVYAASFTDLAANTYRVQLETAGGVVRSTYYCATTADTATFVAYEIPVGFEVTLSDSATSAQLVDDVWDEVLTGGTHNVVNSAGRRLRNIQDFSIYELASVWVDEVGGTSTGTAVGDDATVTNRADDFDNAQTVAASVGLDRIHVQSGNSITLTATLNGYEVWGKLYAVALGGQDIGSTFFNGATISGIGTGTIPKFFDCLIGTATLPPCFVIDSGLTATLTVGSAGAYRFIDCRSGVAGASAPVVDLGSAVGATTMEFRRWSGGLTLNNVAAGDVVSVDVVSGGTITVNGSGGSVVVRGLCNVVDGSGGSVTITESSVVNMTKINSEVDTAISDAALATAAALATVDSNVDAILVDTGTTIPATLTDMSGATFDTATDSLEQIRNNIGAGDATAANQTTILSRLGSPSDLGGGADIANNIFDLAGATFSTSTDSLEQIRDNIAASSDADLLISTTIATLTSQTSFTLTAGSSDDDAYNGMVAIITDAATANQKAVAPISDYTGATKTVTLQYDPAVFTMAATDTIDIVAHLGIKGAQNTADTFVNVSASNAVDANLVSSTVSATTITSGLTGSSIEQKRGDRWSFSITGMGAVTGYSNLWFTVKLAGDWDDADSMVMIDTDTGLVYINAGSATTAANGSITVDDADAGNISVVLEGVETAKLPIFTGKYDVQLLNSSNQTSTLTEGTFEVTSDVTRATS